MKHFNTSAEISSSRTGSCLLLQWAWLSQQWNLNSYLSRAALHKGIFPPLIYCMEVQQWNELMIMCINRCRAKKLEGLQNSWGVVMKNTYTHIIYIVHDMCHSTLRMSWLHFKLFNSGMKVSLFRKSENHTPLLVAIHHFQCSSRSSSWRQLL